jgi:hypothetical protein
VIISFPEYGSHGIGVSLGAMVEVVHHLGSLLWEIWIWKRMSDADTIRLIGFTESSKVYRILLPAKKVEVVVVALNVP